MVVFTTNIGTIRVPAWVKDHPSFLRWLRSGTLPEEARVSYINGEVWVETMPERAFAHNQVKTLIARVLCGLVEDNDLGVFFGDGMTYTSKEEKFTAVPDGMFVSQESIDAGRVRLTGGKDSNRDTELIGTPDLLIEVVSDSSEDKDNEWQMSRYWNLGVPEYWVVDGRQEPLRFTIYRRGPKGYMVVRKADGWAKSAALGRSFRFTPYQKKMGFGTYKLEVR